MYKFKKDGKILALIASPRKNGNSEILLKEAVKKFKKSSIKIVRTSSLNISHCQSCGFCEKKGFCKINDDFQKISLLLAKSDIVVVASPVYFYGLPSHFKSLIDRAQSFWAKKYILKKTDSTIRPVYTILVGGSRGEKLFLGSRLTLKYFYDVFNLENSGELLVRGADKKGDVKKCPNYMRQARRLIH